MTITLSFNLPQGKGTSSGTVPAGSLASGVISVIDPTTGNATGWDYSFPDITKRPRGPVWINRIYLPIQIQGAGVSTAPAKVSYQLNFRVRGEVRWSHAGELTMQSTGPNASGANDIIADDLVNPILVQPEEVGRLEYGVAFDQQVLSIGFYVAAQLGVQIAPGTIYCTYEPD